MTKEINTTMEALLNSTNKSSEIVRSALELFAQKGYDGTTIRDIARAAGVTDGAMYRHFSGKEEMARTIFETLMRQYSNDLKQLIEQFPDLTNRVEKTVHLTYSYYGKYPSAVCFALKSQHNFWETLSPSVTHPHTLINKIVAEGLENGEISQGSLLVLGGIFSGALMEPLTFHFYLVKGPVDMEKMAGEVAARLLKMLK